MLRYRDDGERDSAWPTSVSPGGRGRRDRLGGARAARRDVGARRHAARRRPRAGGAGRARRVADAASRSTRRARCGARRSGRSCSAATLDASLLQHVQALKLSEEEALAAYGTIDAGAIQARCRVPEVLVTFGFRGAARRLRRRLGSRRGRGRARHRPDRRRRRLPRQLRARARRREPSRSTRRASPASTSARCSQHARGRCSKHQRDGADCEHEHDAPGRAVAGRAGRDPEQERREPHEAELKGRHRAMWASGDYPSMVETFLLPLGPLVQACGIGPGMTVLDVAAGTGDAAIERRRPARPSPRAT